MERLELKTNQLLKMNTNRKHPKNKTYTSKSAFKPYLSRTDCTVPHYYYIGDFAYSTLYIVDYDSV